MRAKFQAARDFRAPATLQTEIPVLRYAETAFIQEIFSNPGKVDYSSKRPLRTPNIRIIMNNPTNDKTMHEVPTPV